MKQKYVIRRRYGVIYLTDLQDFYSGLNQKWITGHIGKYLFATAIFMVLVSAIGIYIDVIFFTRVSGLRSFSKMSCFDFAMTVAVGSLIASAILAEDPPLLQAVIAMGALYALQIGINLQIDSGLHSSEIYINICQ